MRRQPALTFAGALKILNKHEPGLIGKLDKALGGVILGAGAVATIGPAGLVAALWGWIDQKNEALGLLRTLTSGLSNRVIKTTGLERRDLILAAHSTIVIASLFEALEEHLGEKAFKRLELSDRERLLLATATPAHMRDSFETLYRNEIPAPSPSRGFEANAHALIDWVIEISYRLETFVIGLLAGEGIHDLDRDLPNRAVERYMSRYIQLAERVPEFLIWSMLGEHAATRHNIGKLDANVRAALDTHGEALAKVEALLSLAANRDGQIGRHRESLRNANNGALAQPLVPGDAERYDTDIRFPTVQKAFLAPHYRIARSDRESRPADESWWADRPVAHDLELMLAAYLTSGDADRVPMLLLGHPGAGKSMLTKVLAARPPTADYTVVRVPLRNVGAGAPIIDQIQQALDAATNGRVSWQQLSDDSADSVVLVLLDGLDELLQAAAFDRSGYLQEVMEFQRIEGEQGRPVAVVVTSRTVVADRVDIPEDATIVKLDEFDDEQIASWLSAWQVANAAAIAAGTVRELTVAEAHHQIDLARQPLLLLMLALYAADPKSPRLDAGLSMSALYERIFDNFARREVQKRWERPLRGKVLEQAVAEQLYRLSVAALAMFNRGSQQLREADLRADLAALQGGEVADNAGDRVLGEFFFVHAPEAVVRTTERSYEFLHATFGEYLVAWQVMGELIGMARAVYAGRITDEMLFALLSHQVWMARPSIVNFAIEIFETLPGDDQDNIRQALGEVLRSYRHRQRSAALDAYRPVPLDFVRQLAAYSANLFTLAISFADPPGQLHLVGPFGDTDEDAQRNWRSTLSLWRSGLDLDSTQAMLFSLQPESGLIMTRSRPRHSYPSGVDELWIATLSGDNAHANRIRQGIAILDENHYFEFGDWAERMHSAINPSILYGQDLIAGEAPPPGTSLNDATSVAGSLSLLLRIRAGDLHGSTVHHAVAIIGDYPVMNVKTMLTVIYWHPDVLLGAEKWHDPARYADHRDELHLIMDHAVDRLDKSLRKEWNLLRAKLLGGALPLRRSTDDEELTKRLLEMLMSAR